MVNFAGKLKEQRQRVLALLDSKPEVLRGNLASLASHFFSKRDRILALAKEFPTPFYIFDEEELTQSILNFRGAFEADVPRCKAYYAMKVNPHPSIMKMVLEHGLGIDASSGRELQAALEAGAQDVLFTGPGKTRSELSFALEKRDFVTINIDSFRELEKLGELTNGTGAVVRAGVRFFTEAHGAWSKFGIPLAELREFWTRAASYPGVRLEGIQFHMSWNRDASPYVQVISQLAEYLREQFSSEELAQIKFIDFGGGFRPCSSEGYYPWKLPLGGILKMLDGVNGTETQFADKYYLTEAASIPEYARAIGDAISAKLVPLLPNSAYFTEPGRIICNNAMHVLLQVQDVKRKNLAIVDGGINIVGWERFEHEYFPLINLTHPCMTREIRFRVYGPLCMPQDMWGYYLYASKVAEGDLILVPCQGALTYSLAQTFIKPIPDVHRLAAADASANQDHS